MLIRHVKAGDTITIRDPGNNELTLKVERNRKNGLDLSFDGPSDQFKLDFHGYPPTKPEPVRLAR